MSKTVRVACMIPNGLMIRLQRPSEDPETGRPTSIPSGTGVRLNGPSSRLMGAGATTRQDVNPGETDVDEAFMREWLDQHQLDAVVTTRQVWIIEENPTGA